ncbi:MAG: toxic anion resistance protein [Oscillospiraceae bacterium]|nr:toxic anion resistance protein [Oscillospiraceae bacterium]MDY2847188.1 toxic anion resistance protein [Oscillospiraceae bacterium]
MSEISLATLSKSKNIAMEENTSLSAQEVNTQLDLTPEDKARMDMLKDISVFDIMYKQNLDCFRELGLYIQAGKEQIEEIRNETVPKLRAEAQASGDPMDAQLVRDFEDEVDRFEKKIYDLELSRTIAIQTAPQIRLIHNNDRVLKESNRGIVDVETLQKVNKNLIDTIEETIQIQNEGRQKREEAEKTLVRIEDDLKNKLVEIMGG